MDDNNGSLYILVQLYLFPGTVEEFRRKDMGELLPKGQQALELAADQRLVATYTLGPIRPQRPGRPISHQPDPAASLLPVDREGWEGSTKGRERVMRKSN